MVWKSSCAAYWSLVIVGCFCMIFFCKKKTSLQVPRFSLHTCLIQFLARFPNKKIQNPTTQDPNSKFHIEKIQNPNPQNIQKIYILRGSEMVYPTLPRKKQQEPIRENNVDPLARFPNKKIQNPTTQDPNSKFHIEQIENPNPQNIQKMYILRGSEMVYPTLPRKKQQEPIRENNVDPLARFPNKKNQNPTTPNSKFHIEQIQNPNPQNIQKIS